MFDNIVFMQSKSDALILKLILVYFISVILFVIFS